MADQSYYGHASTAAAAAPAPTKASIDAGKIFVGGLSWQTTEESLRYHFEQYGPVASVELMKDRHTGDPRGFAFVVFTSGDTVDMVMNEGRHEINHKVVDVKRAQARGIAPPSIHQNRVNEQQGESSTMVGGSGGGGGGNKLSAEQLHNKIFIGGLPPHIDKEALKRCFEQFGAVSDAIVMMDQAQQRSRGFGFITFENGTNGAQKAIDVQPVNVDGRLVEVKLATPKENQAVRSKPVALGLRAGVSGSSSGEYAGLAASYGRNGWRAGYGSQAFGAAGWAVKGWDRGTEVERSGFSFDMLKKPSKTNREPPSKRARYSSRD